MKIWLSALVLFLSVGAARAEVGYTHKACEAAEGGHVVMPINLETGEAIPGCAPDVLYSWKSARALKAFVDGRTDTNIIPFRGQLWMWRTPVGTFGYGDFVVRTKLKPGVKFYWNKVWDSSGGCRHLTPEQQKTTVVFGYYGGLNYSEYIVCSPEVVESWSYGTPEVYVEMKKEYNWTQAHYSDFTQFDRFYKTQTNPSFTDTDYVAGNYFRFKIDGMDWTPEALQQKFLNLKKELQAGRNGDVFYAPGVVHDRARHYLTTAPDYFSILSLDEVNQPGYRVPVQARH